MQRVADKLSLLQRSFLALAAVYLVVYLTGYIFSGSAFLTWAGQSLMLEFYLLMCIFMAVECRKQSRKVEKIKVEKVTRTAHRSFNREKFQNTLRIVRNIAIGLAITIGVTAELLLLGISSPFLHTLIFIATPILIVIGVIYYKVRQEGEKRL
jgi:uncharacterized membrane protein